MNMQKIKLTLFNIVIIGSIIVALTSGFKVV